MTDAATAAQALTIPTELLPADGRFGCGPSKVRPEQLAALAGAQARADGNLAPPEAGQASSSARVRGGLAELFDLPDGYTVALGNGGATAFWDAATFGLVRERAHHLAFGEFSVEVREGDAGGAVPRRTRSSSGPSPGPLLSRSPTRAPTCSRGRTTRPRPA